MLSIKNFSYHAEFASEGICTLVVYFVLYLILDPNILLLQVVQHHKERVVMFTAFHTELMHESMENSLPRVDL